MSENEAVSLRAMRPQKLIPCSDEFSTPEEYIESLLQFATTTDIFQILCGGVHILDFFTSERSLFESILPADWREFILQCEDIDAFLDLLMRDDLDALSPAKYGGNNAPPESLIQYIRKIRLFSLDRSFTPSEERKRLPKLTRNVAVGMTFKKVHEVTHFADYVDRLVDNLAAGDGDNDITHLVDFGSGQNYLGRALASPPYNRYVVAVEGREHNIAGAKELDVSAGIAERPVVRRNKKLLMRALEEKEREERRKTGASETGHLISKAKAKPDKPGDEKADLRPRREIGVEVTYAKEEGRGYIQYIVGQLTTGDLSNVISKIDHIDLESSEEMGETTNQIPLVEKLMAISIHSCGNLSHFGIRSLILNPSIRAVAIVGCCYNLLTERLGPPTCKWGYLRPSLQPVNGRVMRESSRFDPEGFPMSRRFAQYGSCGGSDGIGKERGIRLNITARMMACQAPENWTKEESDAFFTRHFYRAVLQRIFLDRGVVCKVRHDKDQSEEDAPKASGFGSTREAEAEEGQDEKGSETPFNMSTNPVIIGSLRKRCYTSFRSYVRGAMEKITAKNADPEYAKYADVMLTRGMADMTDDDISAYDRAYAPRRKEIAAVWSLMAFSARVVEAIIVCDRWSFLDEHKRTEDGREEGLVKECWVETVFEYGLSPRNLVVVGIKR